MAKRPQLRDFRRAVRRWQRRLGIEGYDIQVVREDLGGNDGEWQHTANVITKPYYLMAKIEIDPAVTDVDVNAAACHELVHVLLSPYQEILDAALDHVSGAKRCGFKAWVQRERERITKQFELALLRARWD